jgi:hypothetical protein
MNHDAPRLVSNEAAVGHLNSVHGVNLRSAHRKLGKRLLPVATLNSATQLGAELVGRAYGGGLLKIEPKEADLLPVPSPASLEEAADELRALSPQVAQKLRGGDLDAAVQMVDDVLLVRHLGVKRVHVRALREAREALFVRRATRAEG